MNKTDIIKIKFMQVILRIIVDLIMFYVSDVNPKARAYLEFTTLRANELDLYIKNILSEEERKILYGE